MGVLLRRADLIKFVNTWLAITSVNVLQESLKRKTATYVWVSHDLNYPGGGEAGGDGYPFYGLYRCVRAQRVWFFSRFAQK